jgi:hypothetical protein
VKGNVFIAHCKHRWMGRDFAPAEKKVEKKEIF